MIALISEVWNDRNGDLHKGADIIVRAALLIIEAFILHLNLHKPFIDSLILSTAFFFLLFDYLIAYVLIRNKVIEPRIGYTWFNYQAKSGVVDNIPFWKRLNPWVKLGVRVVVFITAILIFILGDILSTLESLKIKQP